MFTHALLFSRAAAGLRSRHRVGSAIRLRSQTIRHELRSCPCGHGLAFLALRKEAVHALICDRCFDSFSVQNLSHRLLVPGSRISKVFVDEPSPTTCLFSIDVTHELRVLLRFDSHSLLIFMPRRQSLKLGENDTRNADDD